MAYSGPSLFKLLNKFHEKSCDSTYCCDNADKEQDLEKDRKEVKYIPGNQ